MEGKAEYALILANTPPVPVARRRGIYQQLSVTLTDSETGEVSRVDYSCSTDSTTMLVTCQNVSGGQPVFGIYAPQSALSGSAVTTVAPTTTR